MSLLESIKGPKDLKKLNIEDLKILAEEIREQTIKVIYENGGHLASNLGIVELTLALHYCFDLPSDKIIFDVGHQSYTHKILSGRNDDIFTIRKKDGLSGFQDVTESPYDAFTTGHAGNAMSAGLGYCYARDIKGDNYYVINVIGDGSLVNGENLEALMSSNEKPRKFIVILNDNGMSISKNNNGFYKMLSKATVKQKYKQTKGFFRNVFRGPIGRGLSAVKQAFKRMFNKNYTYIENFGFKYVGVLDGHNIKELVTTLNNIKNSEESIFLHVKTVKGKGYKEAEDNAEVYHGIGKHLECSANDFSFNLGKTLVDLAKDDDKIIAITAGMKDGTGLTEFARVYKNRFFDVGICEEYAVTLAGGMAAAGIKPVVCIYSTFLQRAYDQIIHDVALQNHHVVFCIDRSGLVGADGKTHQGVFDTAYLRHIPNLIILSPKDRKEQSLMLKYALSESMPVAIKYPNGRVEDYELSMPIQRGKWEIIKNSGDVVILANGSRSVRLALEVADAINKSVSVVNARFIKPLDEEYLEKIKNKKIITIEDGSLAGGFGSAVLEYYAKQNESVTVKTVGVKDGFVAHADVKTQMQQNGIEKEEVIKIIESL